MYVHMYAYIYAHMHICTYMYLYIYAYVYMCTYIYKYTYRCVYICIYTHTCICTRVYTYIHTHIDVWQPTNPHRPLPNPQTLIGLSQSPSKPTNPHSKIFFSKKICVVPSQMVGLWCQRSRMHQFVGHWLHS